MYTYASISILAKVADYNPGLSILLEVGSIPE